MRSQLLLYVLLLFGLLVGSSLAQCHPQECEDGKLCEVDGEGKDATAKCIAQEDAALAQSQNCRSEVCANGEECVITGEGKDDSAACMPGEVLPSAEPEKEDPTPEATAGSNNRAVEAMVVIGQCTYKCIESKDPSACLYECIEHSNLL